MINQTLTQEHIIVLRPADSSSDKTGNLFPYSASSSPQDADMNDRPVGLMVGQESEGFQFKGSRKCLPATINRDRIRRTVFGLEYFSRFLKDERKKEFYAWKWN
ncbi:unnamed protein product [Amoebophrya sp. A25]|nr:unnamed protein product [Amoebophrya sp. A25]|eukprot:GSA25T00012777001.1